MLRFLFHGGDQRILRFLFHEKIQRMRAYFCIWGNNKFLKVPLFKGDLGGSLI
ncbi:hypothetical protein MC7420_5646 [Coleofasciculus chthonoplastes PCC 7420]|uniref:Uncharacterized protein n=1 Tax=Coleofasciculus chthonoplastes PCC 7420 TaxID=118168 RepID=B4VPI5_9CYAN|nr:hypothetical protein MC7420_5646 [Coleofasciculus chthonoplastes PCC 7420]